MSDPQDAQPISPMRLAAIHAMTDDFNPSPHLNSDQNREQRRAYHFIMSAKLELALPHLRAEWELPIHRLHSPKHDSNGNPVCSHCSATPYPCPTIETLETQQ